MSFNSAPGHSYAASSYTNMFNRISYSIAVSISSDIKQKGDQDSDDYITAKYGNKNISFREVCAQKKSHRSIKK